MSDQRATVSVPSYATSMNIGAAWSGTSWNSAGLTVDTSARVWLESERASGASARSSTLSLLANGATKGVGQLLLQSLKSNVYLFAERTTVAAANESLFLAGAEGVKVLAGRTGPLDIMFDPSAESAILRVAPDDEDPSSDHAAAYLDTLDGMADYWAWGDLAVSSLMVTFEALRQAFGLRASGSSATTAAAVAAMATAAKVSSAGVDFARVGVDEVKGLHLFSYSGVNLMTTGFASLYGGAALTVAGLLTTGMGFVQASVVGGLSASMKATGTVSVAGSHIDMVAAKDVTLGALGGVLGGKLIVRGKGIEIGAAVPPLPTQLPTTSITGGALSKLAMTAYLGAVSLEGTSKVELTGNTLEIDSTQEVVIEGPTYTITVNALGVSIAIAAGAKVAVASSSVKAAHGPMSLEVSATGVKIGGAAAALEVDSLGVWSWKGPVATLL